MLDGCTPYPPDSLVLAVLRALATRLPQAPDTGAPGTGDAGADAAKTPNAR
ncbi:hypothetical protein AB0H73_38580 [Streptomyces olivoreticuli]